VFKRYYDPEILLHSLDGIDRANHIVATYSMDDEIPGEDFIEHFALIQSMASEGSTGTWEKVGEDTEEIRRKLSSKLVGYFEIPTGNPSRRMAVVQLAFPIDAWIDNVPMLLSIAGNCFAYSPKLRLLDVFIPENLLARFKGPKFGVPGLRKAPNVPERPLSLHIIKPKMGMTPQQVADQCYQTAPGVFFTAGQRPATHCWIASSRRSRARRAGRCRLQCIALKTFQTWPEWYRTPVSRSITVATRGSVHRSVPKPWARAPWRKARSTCSSWGRSSWGLRPARPAPRSAAKPPRLQARCQRLTLWRLTWSARATKVGISPAQNSFAACLRRASKAWKSLRGRTDRFMRPVYTKC